jgi:hypothetical protein
VVNVSGGLNGKVSCSAPVDHILIFPYSQDPYGRDIAVTKLYY